MSEFRKILAYTLAGLGAFSAISAAYWAGQQSKAELLQEQERLIQNRLSTQERAHVETLTQRSLFWEGRLEGINLQCVQSKDAISSELERCVSNTLYEQEKAADHLEIFLSQKQYEFSLAIQHERVVASEALAAAISQTELRVRSEMTSDLRLTELQGRSLANLVAILNQPAVREVVPETYKPIVEAASFTVPLEVIDLAEARLPPLPNTPLERQCVKVGQEIEMFVGQYVDQCESGVEVVLTKRYYAGPDPFIEATVNGIKSRLNLGQRLDISDNCYMSLLRMTNENEERIAAFRFGCN